MSELYDQIGRTYAATRRTDPRIADGEFDAAMAVLSDHHWGDRRRGLRELRRVARRRVVLFNADPSEAGLFWLTTEYRPGPLDLISDGYRRSDLWERDFIEPLGPVQLIPVPIPHDCEDGFYAAFWRRPEAYLEPAVRSGISVFAQLDDQEVREGIDALGGDLESGRWRECHRELLELAELHLGFYVVLAELGSRTRGPKLSGDGSR